MKKFFINLFRGNPTTTGFLILLVLQYLLDMQKNWFPVLFFYFCSVIFYMVCILPKIEPQKREKKTWLLIASLVVFLTIIEKFFMV